MSLLFFPLFFSLSAFAANRVHMSGEIKINGKELPIVVHLEKSEEESNSGSDDKYFGFYYYLSSKIPISLVKSNPSNDKTGKKSNGLAEFNFVGGTELGNNWSLDFNSNQSAATGVWTSGSGKSGSIHLKALTMPDSSQLILFPTYRTNSKSKKVSIEIQQTDGEITSILVVYPEAVQKKLKTRPLLVNGEPITESLFHSENMGWWDNRTDFNSDGFKDLAFRTELINYNQNNYALWIFDPHTSSFESAIIKDYEGELCNPEPDHKKKEITVSCVLGKAGAFYKSARFKFSKFTLIPIQIESMTGDEEETKYNLQKVIKKGDLLETICDCMYDIENQKIKNCAIKKDRCRP